jgi:predicted dehydrogenase
MTDQGRPVGFLVVGAGFLGTQRAFAVAASRGARLIGVVDIDEPAAIAAARRLEVVASTDYESALELPGVDAVIIATPHADHGRQVAVALEAGKHVLCEKPLTIDPDEARLLAVSADERRLRLATGFNHRFYPPVRDALEMTAAWKIGRVEAVRAEIGHRATPAFLAGWHTDVARSGGGTLMDNGPHACDLIRLLLGEVVAAKGYRRETLGLARGCEVEAFALFRDFDQGVAELRSSWNQPTGYLTLEIRGTEGWLRVETAPWRLSGELTHGQCVARSYLTDRVAERVFRTRFGCERSLVREIEAFLAPEETGPRAGGSGWDGCRVTEMIDAVYRSHDTGAEVRLDPLQVRAASFERKSELGRVA